LDSVDNVLVVVQWVMIAVALGMALWSLWTQEVHIHEWEVTRASDPITYWLVVAVELGVAGYLIYRAIRG